MKVTRKRELETASDTHTIQVTLTTADVKAIFLSVRDLLNKCVGMGYNPTFTKKDLLFTIRKHFAFLGEYGSKLGEWAFSVAIRNEFILQVSDAGYRINPAIMELRHGRTSKEVMDFLYS